MQIDVEVQRTWTLGCVGKFIWPLPDKDLKKRLHRIQAPTLIIWGQQDQLVPPIYAQEFAKRILSAHVEILEQAAHMPHLEQLAVVSRMVQAFLPA